jgi:hypothetical protein
MRDFRQAVLFLFHLVLCETTQTNSDSILSDEKSAFSGYNRNMATRAQFENSNEIGVFTMLTNKYCLVA